MNGCAYTLKGWNIHHRAHHKGVLLTNAAQDSTLPVHITHTTMCMPLLSLHMKHVSMDLHSTVHYDFTATLIAKSENTGASQVGVKKPTDGPKISTNMWANTFIINSAVKNMTILLMRKGY